MCVYQDTSGKLASLQLSLKVLEQSAKVFRDIRALKEH